MGRWHELIIPWYESSAVSCALCGQLIPRRAWAARVAGESLLFCGRRCEQIYRRYWLPRHGGGSAAGSAERGGSGRGAGRAGG